MSATYNWAYKPGVTNKYNIIIDASDDNVAPDNAVYVALFGNDTTGNGSRQYPLRTITKASTLPNNYIILGSGVYRELAPIPNYSGHNLVGDGDVIIDIIYNKYFFTNNPNALSFYNITFRGNGIDSLLTSLYIQNSSFYDIYFNGCFVASGTGSSSSVFTNCIIDNVSMPIQSVDGTNWTNVTVVNCNCVQFIYNTRISLRSIVFDHCNIDINDGTGNIFEYTLFSNCNFCLSGTNSGGPIYPGLPAGYTYYDSIADLRNAWSALYGGSSFTGCFIGDVLFNNLAIGDYTLQFTSPAKNLSYFGTYVGARSVALPVTVSSTESSGGFDFSTIVNLSVSNNSIMLVNPAQNGSIQTNLFVNSTGRQLARLPVYGYNADRNGQYIDSISNLSGSVQQPGGTLTAPTPYLVETGSINYNNSVYQPGDRLTTVEGVTSFSSDFGGTLREITEAPERHTIMMRCGNGGGTVTAGSALTAGYWYYLISGSITYNGTAYGGGQSFKAIGSGGFSGSGNVITALGPETFNHYEPGIQPTTNNEGDTRTGAILRGNGDPAYVRGGYGVQEFPINARFIQLYYIINVANLKP